MGGFILDGWLVASSAKTRALERKICDATLVPIQRRLLAQQAKTERLKCKADGTEPFCIGRGGMACFTEAVSMV